MSWARTSSNDETKMTNQGRSPNGEGCRPAAVRAPSFVIPLTSPPHVPSRHRSPRPPLLAHRRQRLGPGSLVGAVKLPYPLPQSQVVHRKHVGPVEHEDEKHLRRPPADAVHV